MKFSINTAPNQWEYRPLLRHLQLEVGNGGVEEFESDSVLVMAGERILMSIPVQFNSVACRELGYDLGNHPSDFYLSRWWSGREWGHQTFVGISVRGIQNCGLGADVPIGTVGRYLTSPSSRVESLFARPELETLIRELRHQGFVSLELASQDLGLTGIVSGIPSWGLYNVLEGVPEGIGAFLFHPIETRLRESWTVSSVLTRWPFPLGVSGNEKVGGLTRSMEKHFWLGGYSQFRDTIYSTHGLVGVATAWGEKPGRAAVLTSNLLGSLSVPQGQFRTDLVRATLDVQLRVGGLLGMGS